MGRRGPLKKTARKKPARAKPRAADPLAMPTWLKGEAAEEWKRIVPLLQARGLVDARDRGPLAGLCQSWGIYYDATRKVSALLARTDADAMEVRRYSATAEQALKAYSATAREYGLTAASRQRLNMDDKPSEEDPAEELLDSI